MQTVNELAMALAANPAAILAIAGGIMFLILIHEFGHWIVARLFGFQTPVFSIGFGKRSWSWVLGKFWDTEFRISPIMLGGYVSIPELQDESTAAQMLEASGKQLENFRTFPIWKRMAVALAGVSMNFIFAVAAVSILFATAGRAVIDIKATTIDAVDSQVTIARDAGLRPGDVLDTIGGATIKHPDDVRQAIQAHKQTPVDLTVHRNGQVVHVTLIPNAEGMIGVRLGIQTEKRFEHMSAFAAIKSGTSTCLSATGAMAKGFVTMIGNIAHRLAASLGIVSPAPTSNDVHGIVGIVQIGSQAFEQGTYDFIWILAMLSLNLAVINIFPFPLLDGGHILFFSIEGITRRPVPIEIRARLSNLFFFLLVGLMFYGLMNDFLNPLHLPK